jgi:hypothetical protein
VATFASLKINKLGNYTLTANTADASLPAVQSSPFSIGLGDLSITFSVPPKDTIKDQPINGGDVEVTVKDGQGNVVPDGTEVDVSIGTDPTGVANLSGTSTGCTAAAETVCALTSGGVATFSDLAIDTTSSGFQLQAVTSGLQPVDLGPVLSDPFAITNTDTSCGKDGNPPCTAEFDPDHTISAPPGTTLIIETNQLDCPPFQGLAGTVTIIPDPDLSPGTVTPVQFTDAVQLGFEVPFPFCKAPTDGVDSVGHLVPLCNEIPDGLDQPDGSVSCVTESVEMIGGSQGLLHSVLYVNEFDPPAGKH